MPFALLGGSITLQYYFGDSDDFFKGKFTTKKDPSDLSEFYQAEDLLKIIAVHPFLFGLFMNKVDPDTEMPTKDTALISLDETHFRVKLFGMEVSFEIIEHEEEIDGETKLTSFTRHERFIDWVPVLADFGYKYLLWDQTWVYSFKRKDDGTVEVSHLGEKFRGPWPVRLIVFFHQYYVLWACEKYINGEAFGTEDIDKQQEQLACLPIHIFKEFVDKIRAEKVKSLEVLRNEPIPDTAAIAQTTETIEKLSALSESEKSTISVVMRGGRTGSVAGPVAAKLITGDEATQDVLNSAMKAVKGGTDKAVNAVLKEVMNHPELHFAVRAKAGKGNAAKTLLLRSEDEERLRNI